MKYALFILLLLVCSTAQADFSQDKRECNEWGNAFYEVATYKRTMSKVDMYDDAIRTAQERGISDQGLAVRIKIIYFVHSLDKTPEEFRNWAYGLCMKARGHKEV